VTDDPQKFLGIFGGVIGLIPSADAPLSPGDASLIAYLRGSGYTDNAQVSVRLRQNSTLKSSVTFGGYDEKMLYPDKNGKFMMIKMKIKKDLMIITDVNI